MGGACERREMQTGFSSENSKEGDHLEDEGVDERIIRNWTLKKWDTVESRLVCFAEIDIRVP
jgi:hypothetical protein